MKIVEIGEIVRYNGYIGMGYGYNKHIKRLMRRLKREYFYKVKHICLDFDDVKGNNYYSFDKDTGINFWCPCQSFDRDYESNRNLLIEKYNLR